MRVICGGWYCWKFTEMLGGSWGGFWLCPTLLTARAGPSFHWKTHMISLVKTERGIFVSTMADLSAEVVYSTVSVVYSLSVCVCAVHHQSQSKVCVHIEQASRTFSWHWDVVSAAAAAGKLRCSSSSCCLCGSQFTWSTALSSICLFDVHV